MSQSTSVLIVKTFVQHLIKATAEDHQYLDYYISKKLLSVQEANSIIKWLHSRSSAKCICCISKPDSTDTMWAEHLPPELQCLIDLSISVNGIKTIKSI